MTRTGTKNLPYFTALNAVPIRAKHTQYVTVTVCFRIRLWLNNRLMNTGITYRRLSSE